MKTLWKVSLGLVLIVGGVYLYADEENEHHAVQTLPAKSISMKDKTAAAMYKKECGSCHMAFEPSMLPKRSWDKTMKTLENHFGTDATLDPADHTMIATYLKSYASKNEGITDLNGGIATRITQTPYFVREHREVSKKMVTQPEVKSLANCTACHTNASNGSYREREIRIPNYGRWE